MTKLTTEQQQIVLKWRRYAYKIAMNRFKLKEWVGGIFASRVDDALIDTVLYLGDDKPSKFKYYLRNRIKWLFYAEYNKYKLYQERYQADINSYDIIIEYNYEEFDDMIKQFNPREKYILIEYYSGNKTCDEISKDLYLTKQRVHQIKDQCLSKLRAKYAT
jgi:RNA polymerase sigma factor (sigma-70 family)